MKDKISWATFDKNNETNKTDAFQTLARRLCAYELGILSWDLSCPKTWPGVEADPVLIGDKWCSFQAKYYDDFDNGWDKLKNSLNTTVKQIKSGNYKLDRYYAFVNWDQPVKKSNRSSDTKNKQEQCEVIAEKGGFKINWRWGEQIIEKLQTDHSPPVQKIVRQFFTLPIQPNLQNPNHSKTEGIYKHHYGSENKIEYIERNDVVKTLDSLILSERLFCWHTIVGLAGVGKSRSILEYCENNLNENWNWGWLSPNCNHDYQSWEPSTNTLIVVDYAMGRGNQLAELLEACVDRSSDFLFKVRVIVAERMTKPWIEEIVFMPTLGGKIVASSLYVNDQNTHQNSLIGMPRETKIRPFQKNDRSKLVDAVLMNTAFSKITLDTEDIVKNIEELDNDFRPLMAALYIEHLARNEDIRHAQPLLESYLKQQRMNHWAPNDVNKDNEFHSALITMCQGISEKAKASWSKDAFKIASQIDVEKHAIVIGLEQSENYLKPMEPDIIGELHALETIYGKNLYDLELVEKSIKSALVLNQKGLIGFLYRAANDFAGHATFKKILMLTFLSTDFKASLINFLILGVNKPGPNRDREAVSNYLNMLSELTNQNLNQHMSEQFCAALVNSAQGFKDADDYYDIKSYFEEALSFARQFYNQSIATSIAGYIGNLVRIDQLVDLSLSEKKAMIDQWWALVTEFGNIEAATKSILSTASVEFSNSLLSDNFSLDSNSRYWLSQMLKILLLQQNDEHTRAVVGNSIVRGCDRLHENEEFDAHRELAEIFQMNLSAFRESDINQHVGNLYSANQKLRNINKGSVHAYRLIENLANTNQYASSILQVAYQTEEE